MVEPLNQPFRSEAYDRLMEAQARHKAASVLLDTRTPAHVVERLETPVSDLKAAREAMGLSQAKFAEALGVDGPRISKMENGERMPLYVDLAVRCLLALEAMK